MTSFPSGILRYAGYWLATEEYSYGMFVIASDNKAYSCGALTDTGTDPIVQPSVVWFPNPNPGGGEPSAWSEYPATQLVRLDQLANLSNNFGTAGQVLSSDGTKIQWTEPPQVIGIALTTPVVVTIPGVTVLDLEFTPTIQCKASVTASINYETLAPGSDTLTITLKGDAGGTSSIVIDDAVLTAVSLGAKQSCVLTGVLPYNLTENVQEQIRLSAVSSGAGSFSIINANVNCIYNIQI
jgi:hypothetical protein